MKENSKMVRSRGKRQQLIEKTLNSKLLRTKDCPGSYLSTMMSVISG
jgi:hypothetical protein